MTRRLAATIHRIRTYTTDRVAGRRGSTELTVLAIDDLLRRLEELVAVDESAPSAIDGYPTKTPGARPDEARGLRVDADGNVVEPDSSDVSLNTVEAAADALVRQSAARDVIHRIRLDAERHAETAGAALLALAAALARADNLRAPLPPTTPQCFVASVIRHLPADDAWIPGPAGKKTRFDGVIEHPWREERLVCQWTYKFTRRWRRLPTEEEMLEYLRTGYVRVHGDERRTA